MIHRCCCGLWHGAWPGLLLPGGRAAPVPISASTTHGGISLRSPVLAGGAFGPSRRFHPDLAAVRSCFSLGILPSAPTESLCASILATKWPNPGHIVLAAANHHCCAYLNLICGRRVVSPSPSPNTRNHAFYYHTIRTVGSNIFATCNCGMVSFFFVQSCSVLAFGDLGIRQHSEFIYFRF